MGIEQFPVLDASTNFQGLDATCKSHVVVVALDGIGERSHCCHLRLECVRAEIRHEHVDVDGNQIPQLSTDSFQIQIVKAFHEWAGTDYEKLAKGISERTIKKFVLTV